MNTLSYYIAQKLPTRNFKKFWRITCLDTLLSCSPSYNIAEAYFKLSRCWDIPNL